jgi:predicted XRE-type DNA-binding protein
MKDVIAIPRNEASNTITQSSGNVFADLELANADERKTQMRLAFAINQMLEKRRLSQADAARQLGISQPKISALSNYRLAGFSVERLLHFLNALGCDVEIVIRNRPRSRKPARTYVTAA